MNGWKLNQRIEVAGLLFGLCRSSNFFRLLFFFGGFGFVFFGAVG